MFLVASVATFGQTKISEMPLFSGATNTASFPIVSGGVNYRVLGSQIIAGKIDSVKFSNDSLYTYTSGIRTYIGKVNSVDAYSKTQSDSRYSLTSHVHSFGSLTGIPTTLAGHNISDAYTKSESDAKYLTELQNSYLLNGVGDGDSLVINVSDSVAKVPRIKVIAGTNVNVDKKTTVDQIEYTISSVGSSGTIVKEGSQTTSVPYDRSTYDGFTSYATKDSTIYQWIKSGDNHVDDGPLLMNKSTNEGTDWTTPTQVVVSGLPIVGGTIEGQYSNDRLIIVFTTGSDYDTVNTAYSNDGGITYTRSGNIYHPSFANIMPFHSPVVLAKDTLLQGCYVWNADTTKIVYFRTTNNGLTWSLFSTAMTQISSLGGFGNSPVSEPSTVKVGGSTASTSVLIAMVRNDLYTAHPFQIKSTDGGATWTNQTWISGSAYHPFGDQINSGPGNLPGSIGLDYGAPVTLLVDGDNIYAFIGRRGNNADYSIRYWKASISTVLAGGYDYWGRFKTIYRALTQGKGSDIDFGYPRGFITSSGKKKIGLYDLSPKHRTGIDGVSTNKRERILIMPVEGLNYFDAFNTTNQSIPSGTETSVSFPSVWYDSERSYSTDSSRLFIPEDGWYYVTVQLQIEASAAGTYREAKVQAVDRGHELGISPALAYNVISKQAIEPNTNDKFCRVELTGQMYLYKGWEIRVTLMHDAGTSLNLVNTTKENRATIRLKKIN